MHILIATVEALGISADELVLNRTSLEQMREQNRQHQSDDAKSDLVDKVMILNLISYYFEYVFSSLLFFFMQ